MCFLSVSLGWCLPEISSVKSVSVCMSTWRIHLGDRVIHLSLLLKACVCVCVCMRVCVGDKFSPLWGSFETLQHTLGHWCLPGFMDGHPLLPPSPQLSAAALARRPVFCGVGPPDWSGFNEESFSLGDIISRLWATAGHLARLPRLTSGKMGHCEWQTDRQTAARRGSQPTRPMGAGGSARQRRCLLHTYTCTHKTFLKCFNKDANLWAEWRILSSTFSALFP